MTATDKTLTDKQRRFVDEYLVDLNATQASIRAGYSEDTARQIGTENLSKPVVAEAIAEAMAARSARVQIQADDVLRYWASLAQADPNRLIQYRRECCRYCHGVDHRYQFTAAEFEREQVKLRVEKAGAHETLDPQGGVGFDARRAPHPDCPECFGEGVGRIHAQDSRKLTGAERLLYRGVKRTKDGFEILMEDRPKAWENIARHLGMFVDRREVSGPDGKPIQAEVTARPDVSALDQAGRDALRTVLEQMAGRSAGDAEGA